MSSVHGVTHGFSSTAAVALITGAGSGIGRAAAIQFADAGCNIVAADINKVAAEETCSLIKDVECLAVCCDITQPDQVAAMVAATKDKFGRLDYAFNNAGISGTAAPVHAMPLEEFDRVLSVNLRGHFIAMQAQIPLMLATSPSPAIVLTSSICGHQAHAGMAGYCASKFGVRGLVKAAAVEYGPRGLRVNSVSPGAVATPLLLDFLASGGGDTYVTGTDVLVDGGSSCRVMTSSD
ncbi:hypothetical protein OEZ86_004573 [Tetradesmus obliquus]|nr:hypothetical protein OEZ86_004573 [Tetradesmus obliquus]